MINNLPSPKTKQKSKKLGRGYASGVGGHTVGRGGKGATARGGHKQPRPGFEGGQNPISRRLPKLKGFTRAYFASKVKNQPIQLSDIDALATENKVTDIDVQTLVEFGLITPRYNKDLGIKVLFDKDITAKINLKNLQTSERVKESIEKAGGTVE
jgi:large subunit ribosomal protein L15